MPRTSSLRAVWNGRTNTWHEHVNTSQGFELIRDQVLVLAQVDGSHDVVDLGAGSGFLTLALAPSCRQIVAVDLAEKMLERLASTANSLGLDNVVTEAADLRDIDLPPGSVDLIVSNYALHHLKDEDKRALLARAHRWLRPGGKIVVADMMFGRGRTAADRRIIKAKIRALLRKGPGGAWRIAKNMVRFGLRQGSELPASPDFWTSALTSAGFHQVAYRPIVAEAGLVVGIVAVDDRRPPR